jgi:hypothetical protein
VSMQQRIEAMIVAVATVEPSLDKFYSLLNDEEKARFNALCADQRRSITARNRDRSLAQSCDVAQPAALKWPTEEIDARLRPTDPQRASLVALQGASAKAADLLKTSCQADDAIMPPARLAAVGKRLDTMLQAVKLVRSALDDFYGTLSDEHKAQFEAIGHSEQPRRIGPTRCRDIAAGTIGNCSAIEFNRAAGRQHILAFSRASSRRIVLFDATMLRSMND